LVRFFSPAFPPLSIGFSCMSLHCRSTPIILSSTFLVRRFFWGYEFFAQCVILLMCQVLTIHLFLMRCVLLHFVL
jgi:hypothetical protein